MKDRAGLAFSIDLDRPVLLLRFAGPQRMLSWSISRPGFTEASSVAWLEVSDADLPVDRDPLAVLGDALARKGAGDAVGLMTACDVGTYHVCAETVEGVTAAVVTTVGLGNGEFVGRRRFSPRPDGAPHPGTINTLVHVSQPLADAALVETIAIVAEARTAAILRAMRQCGRPAVTGTGSDCIVVASPPGGEIRYAGLHTAVGEAVGAAVMRATETAAVQWVEDDARRHALAFRAAGMTGGGP